MQNLKTLGWYFVLSPFLLLFAFKVQAQPSLELLWKTEGLSVPESVYVYREGRSNFLFVSQIDGDSSTADGQGGIAKLSLSGEIENLNWVTGLNAPKGMAVFKGKLYVADINQLVVVDIKSAEIEKKITIPDAVFLNDVTVDSKGVIYVSDTRTNKVHRYSHNLVEDYLLKVDRANGLSAIGVNIVVGAGTELLLVDKNKNRLPIATGFAQAIDGIESLNKGDFLVSCWAGLIYYVHLSGKKEVLLDSQQEGINTADIGFDSTTKTVYVPNFLKNSVTAYRINME